MMIGDIQERSLCPCYPVICHLLAAGVAEARFASIGHHVLVPALGTDIGRETQHIDIFAGKHFFDFRYDILPDSPPVLIIKPPPAIFED
jgi:hypothetical protein